MKILVKIAIILFFFMLVLSPLAYAYIDPGSGSMVMTAILGILAAVGFTFRKYFYKIRRIFGGRAAQEEDEDPRE